MPYIVSPGYKSPILDINGDPIAEGTTTVSIADPSKTQLIADAGELYLVGGDLGVTDVTVGGVTHEVTSQAAPFDWSLGAPVPL